jgi:hypothetical protein
MAITVTAAESVATFDGVLLQVMVLTGIAGSPIGATAVQSSSAAAAHQANITVTGAGSQVYAASASVGLSSYGGNANTTVLTDHADSPNGLETAAGRTTSATGGAGSLSVGFSSPSTAGGAALLEILPSGTITEDGSSPAAVYNAAGASVTTASFTPPAGSLLVAMVGADANTSTVLTVSDSSSLTWTQQVVAQTTGALYAGVWTAQVPAGDATVSGQVAALALAAAAGTVAADATVAGVTGPLALAAPAGAAQSNAVVIAGPVAALTLTAPAGTAGSGIVSSVLPLNLDGSGIFQPGAQPQGPPLGGRYIREY